MTVGLFLCCLGYVLGSFPSGVVLGRLFTGSDPRTRGSGNFGAANVARVAGWRLGAAVAVLDIVKGALPVLVGRWAGQSATILAAIALTAVLGHDFSMFLRLRGGKGVATTLGVTATLAPVATIFVAVMWLGVLAITGISSLASLVALALLPVLMAVTHQPPGYVVVALALLLLGVAKHWENIFRLIQGTESGFRKPAADGG